MRERLKEIIDQFGVDNVRFIIPMQRIGATPFRGIGIRSSDSPEVRNICRIDERRYRINDNYKIELRAINDQDPDNYFGSESFYFSDLSSMMSREPEIYVVFVPMTQKKFLEITTEWTKQKSPELRLGQALVNAMVPTIVDPEIFFEKDPKKAGSLFWDRYVDIEEEADVDQSPRAESVSSSG